MCSCTSENTVLIAGILADVISEVSIFGQEGVGDGRIFENLGLMEDVEKEKECIEIVKAIKEQDLKMAPEIYVL